GRGDLWLEQGGQNNASPTFFPALLFTTEGVEANVAQYPLDAGVFETLIRMTPEYGLVPALATEWSFKEPNTWRFSLRRNVTFHNGRPFTAEAVKHTFDRIAEQGGGLMKITEDSTKVVDDHTVEITPGVENSRLPEQTVHPSFGILAPATDPADERIGTGPFRFVRYRPRQDVVVRRYDDYWGEKARLEELTFRFIPDPNSRRLALQAGDVAIIHDLPQAAVEMIRNSGDLKVEQGPVGAYEAVYLNGTDSGHPALRDVGVRRAIGYGIDRDAIIRAGFEGVAADAQTLVPPQLLGEENVRAIDGYTHDPQRAQRLLDEAGWAAADGGARRKGGHELQLSLINGFPDASVHGPVPELLQAQLREVGIDVEIVRISDNAAYADRLNAGRGDLWLEQGGQNNASPTFFPALLFTTEDVSGSTEGYHALFSPGQRYDRVISRALATPDPEEAKRLTAQALQILIADTATVLPLAGIHGLYATADDVEGFEPAAAELHQRYNTVGRS
ncbi:MAG TPA: ABC transporter substrate-binding protein, partial [Solirubrobacteraceae bacterium]|nr:ABC transporter substrate-binding protein [Solirubrobacteraceae bacterium]